MKSLLTTIALSLVLLTSGCSLIPKKVEFFQSKVHKFPVATASQVEYQKEAALLAKQRAAQTVDAALTEGSTTNVLTPARDAEKLTDAVSTSLGPPVKPATDADEVVAKLQKKVAQLENRLQAFKQENDEMAGKKVEGTGLLQVPYFAYVGLIALVILVVWHLAKLALTAASAANPGAAVGLGVVNAGGAIVAKGFSQVVAGGEDFLSWVKTKVEDPKLQADITSAFKSLQKQNQDQDVQTLVEKVK